MERLLGFLDIYQSLRSQDQARFSRWCGTGENAIVFARRGATVSAIDLSSGMLALARTKNSISGDFQIDFGEMPSKSTSYTDQNV